MGDEDEHETLKAEIFDAVKSAMTFMELDFKSIDIRKKFLTDYLLMEGVENENENFIAEIEEEQKNEEGGMNDDEVVDIINNDAEDGVIATINQTNFNQPQMSPSDNSPIITSVSYSYADSVEMEEDKQKQAKKKKVKDELRKKRENLKSNGNEMELMKMDNLKMRTNDATMDSTVV